MTSISFLSAAAAAGGIAPTRLDPLRLFLDADIVVQAVIVGLLLASIWVWSLIIGFSLRMANLRRKANRFEDDFWTQHDLDALLDTRRRREIPSARVAAAGLAEYRSSQKTGMRDRDGARLRIAQALEGQVAQEADRLAERLGFLATTGAVAPFVGLFGTVWGIMNSFRALAHVSQATLAVVAPGIAEALIATAMGLLAAIPAVVAYNRYAASTDAMIGECELFAEEFSSVLHRQAHSRREH